MAAPMSKAIVKSLKGAALIDGIHTDVLCSSFDDRIFIVITQYQKLGTLVHVCQDSALNENVGGVQTYTTKVLLGNDEPVTHVIARNLAGEMNTHKPIIFALALRDTSPCVVRALQRLILQYKVW